MADDAEASSRGVDYPAGWEADVVLRDGGTVHVRPIRTDDADALQDFHVGQSKRSTYFRFFGQLERLPDGELRRFTQVDHNDRVALVAVAVADEGGVERIIGVARYDRTADDTAEVAFNVADRHHGRGLGSILLEHLAAAARECGIHRFTAEVLPENDRMFGVFREAGYVVRQGVDDGIVWVSFDIDPTARSLAVMADREHRAEARSVHELLTPRTVLVVTDQTSPDHLRACAVLRHLVDEGVRRCGGDRDMEMTYRDDGEFVVHVVGWAEAPAPSRVWPDVTAVPGPVDLLVLAVAAKECADVVRRCARLRPRSVLVLSSGFTETGSTGPAHQRKLVRRAHAVGARVLGPGSFGFLRRDGDGGLTVNASLAADLPVPGRVGLFCQSASLAGTLLDSANERRVGVSTFVSSGHQADVSGNDLMQYWTEDAQTDVVALCIESVGNPRKFSRILRRLGAVKPVVALLTVRSGNVAPAGHVSRGTCVPHEAFDDMLRQSGVIRVTNRSRLLDAAQLMAHQPLPRGPRVTVLANSRALAALVTEAVESAGLTVTSSREICRDNASTGAGCARLDEELARAYVDTGSDAVVVAYAPTPGGSEPVVARAVARAAVASGRTTVACIRGLSGVTPDLAAQGPDGRVWTVPAYPEPEDGAMALAGAVHYGTWRTGDHGRPLAPEGVDVARARRCVAGALVMAPRGSVIRLDAEQTAELLGCYGIAVLPSRAGAEEGESAAQPGETYVIRSREDARFGPVVSLDRAADAVHPAGAVAHGIVPLTDIGVGRMIRRVCAGSVHGDHHDGSSRDTAGLEDLLGRVAVMAEDAPELRMLELPAVAVGEGEVAVVSARVELAAAGRADGPRRVLPN